jgi:SAM-dependent methyltransferase
VDITEHWEDVYKTKCFTDVSWYESDPQKSFDLIVGAASNSLGRVIDIGGGQSFLVDRLLDAGFEHVAVLDISQTAIEATKARLGERASQVEWIVADITRRDSLGDFDVWHDRAADPASARFRSIAEIILRGIQRCVAADRELHDESGRTSGPDEPVLGNLEDSLPEPLAFISDKPLSVSRVSKTLGFGDAQDIQNGGNS